MVDKLTFIYAFYFIFFANNIMKGGVILKKLSKILIFLILFSSIFLSLSINTNATSVKSKKVLLGGDTIGLKLNTGVYVVGKYLVSTSVRKESPWRNSNIEEGDKIIAYDGQIINTNKDLQTMLKNETKDEITLKLERDKKEISTKINVVTTKTNDKSLGLYIKDKLIGIGTLTFIDTEKNAFATLGHGIYDEYVKMGKVNGTLSHSVINSIKKSTVGVAGEKRASLVDDNLGIIAQNKSSGVYGKLTTRSFSNKKLIQTASQQEVKIGPAEIYTVVSGNKIEKFNINITEIHLQNANNVKGLKYEITDSKLLDKTGGIVQGMSGSPIVQNDKLVGAVSHVIIDNPKCGYGVHIEWMINDINTL